MDSESYTNGASNAEDPQTAAIVRKIVRHLMPVLGIMYLIAYIDRQNIGYAKLQMVGDLGMTETAFGLGSSLFFIGYLLFELPSNLFLAKVGARVWFARIMVSWGARDPGARIHPERDDVLRAAVPARRTGSRFLSRRAVCTDPVGSLGISRPARGHVHGMERDRQHGGRRHRRVAVGCGWPAATCAAGSGSF